MANKIYTVTVKSIEEGQLETMQEGDVYIELPDDILTELDLSEGDEVKFSRIGETGLHMNKVVDE